MFLTLITFQISNPMIPSISDEISTILRTILKMVILRKTAEQGDNP